ncbi:hypothetical protein ACDA63_08485 [Uliginosibacterium sp. sgz301328]|uniref:hypothetical protein n=1 Tax=Uliginosibacterium sp. sgz301328 TaxID=3243764 RepID=UPI00359D5D01
MRYVLEAFISRNLCSALEVADVRAAISGINDAGRAADRDFGTGAAAVGGATAAIALLSDQLDRIPTTLSKDERDAILQLAGQTVAYAISGGGSQGNAASAAAGVADTYNRQLHPDEMDLARELARKSGGKYSPKQIQDALRAANNNALGETTFSNAVIQYPNPETVFDQGASYGVAQTTAGPWLIQNIPANVDVGLAAYIQENTGVTYSWAAGSLSDYAPSSTNNRPVDPFGAGWNTGEYSAGVLPGKLDLRTDQEVNQGQCELVCSVLSPGNLIPGGITVKEIGGWALKQVAGGAACKMICKP